MNIDTNTLQDAERIFTSVVNKYTLLRRNKLLSYSLYILFKNCISISMKEIFAVYRVDVRLIGYYENLICDNYLPTNLSDYVNEYGATGLSTGILPARAAEIVPALP